jgi:hypothetical protein
MTTSDVGDNAEKTRPLLAEHERLLDHVEHIRVPPKAARHSSRCRSFSVIRTHRSESRCEDPAGPWPRGSDPAFVARAGVLALLRLRYFIAPGLRAQRSG